MTEAADDAKPFSIRQFACGLRQKVDIAKNWPFSDKHLKLCLDKGLTHILPPMEGAAGACFPGDREKVAASSMMEKESNIICCTQTQQNGASVEAAECAAVESNHLCRQMNHLSISMGDEHQHEQDREVCIHPSLPSSQDSKKVYSRTKALSYHMYTNKNLESNFRPRVCTDEKYTKNPCKKNDYFRPRVCTDEKCTKNPCKKNDYFMPRVCTDEKYTKNPCKKNDYFMGKKRKGGTKKKSLAEIFATAKHCVLDGFDKVLYVSSRDSFTPCEGDYLSEEKEVDAVVAGAKSNYSDKDSTSKFTEDSSTNKKKHHHRRRRRCKDNAAAADDMYGRPIKKSRLGAAARATTVLLPKDQSVYYRRQRLSSCKLSEKQKEQHSNVWY